jgi:hypothetical protein
MTQTQIPDQMTALVLDSYSGAEALRVEQRPVPKPGKGREWTARNTWVQEDDRFV